MPQSCAQYHQEDSLLVRTGLLSSKINPEFDSITRLAVNLLDADVALVSIIDEPRDRQYFASQMGLEEPWRSRRQTPLSHSFCRIVKDSNDALIVNDATRDPRVQDNLAIRDLSVRAYIGVPVRTPDSAPVGALCAIKATPHSWTDQDLANLQDLARCLNDEIALRAAIKEITALREVLQQAHDTTQRYSAMRESVMQAFMAPDLSLEQRLDAVLVASCSALKADQGAILKVDGGAAQIIACRAPTGTPRSATAPGDIQHLLAGHVASGAALLHLHDVAASPLNGRLTAQGDAPRAYIGIPLTINGVLVAVMELAGDQPRAEPWGEAELSAFSAASMLTAAHIGASYTSGHMTFSKAAFEEFVSRHPRGVSPP